jgi:2-dehydropantoate 2-reductase
MNKKEIINNLNTAHLAFWDTAIHLPNANSSVNGKWSVAQNVEHINIALSRVNNYLALPKSTIKSKFGLSERTSKSNETVIKLFKNALENGAKAMDSFISELNLDKNSKELVSQGKDLLAALISNLQNWSEEEFELYNCPHPFLGKFTVREILYFTIYHVQHHNETIKIKPINQISKTRIAIAGIGGIGGYIGGKLAHHYSDIENVEIIFIARGEMAEAIDKNGLLLLSNGFSYKCVPTLTSDNPIEIGSLDIFIVCTKNFSVEEIFKKYAKCLSPTTTVITTQNTVNGKEIVTPYLPDGATLMEGSIYISSKILNPGKIQHVSGPSKFIFGTDGKSNHQGEYISNIFTDAGIDTLYTDTIKTVLWKKFMFVSPTAMVTAIYQITFSEILYNKEAEYLFIELVSELMQLAIAKNVEIDDNTVLNNLKLLENFGSQVKSSFQLDLEKSKPTEIKSLINYVINESKIFQIPTPSFDKALIKLFQEYKILVE